MGSLFAAKKNPEPKKMLRASSKDAASGRASHEDTDANADGWSDLRGLVAQLNKSQAAKDLCLTTRMVDDFVAELNPTPSTPLSKPVKTGMLPCGGKKVREVKGFAPSQLDEIQNQMKTHFQERQRQGMIIMGNGRSVLGHEAGGAVDNFSTVVRFNDYQIEGFEKHVGRRTDMWVMSDYTCVKLLQKYEKTRSLDTRVLIAIPWRFMGKDYYEARRAEVEAELKQVLPEVAKRVEFISGDVGKDLIGRYDFGDRWPSSGLLTIWNFLNAEAPSEVYLHGFDFFKQIDGKIHYMEDTHKANHDAKQEERVCLDLCKEKRVHFIC